MCLVDLYCNVISLIFGTQNHQQKSCAKHKVVKFVDAGSWVIRNLGSCDCFNMTNLVCGCV